MADMRVEPRKVRLDPGLETISERLTGTQAHCVLATVVAAVGSTYRKPGARMLIEPDGQITGLLSGGCLEQDLREHASSILGGGSARTITYDMRTDNDLLFGVGSGCIGCLDILLEPVHHLSRAGYALAAASDAARRGRTTTLIAVHDGPADSRGTYLGCAPEHPLPSRQLADVCGRAIESSLPHNLMIIEDSVRHAALVQFMRPLPAVLICGAGPDARPVVDAIRSLHFPVAITDHRAAYVSQPYLSESQACVGSADSLGARLDLQRFFAAIVMSHHWSNDLEYLRCLARTDVEYIGVLGPAARRSRLLAELGPEARGLRDRLRGPVGLDIGAVTPEAIALAIAAEIYAAAAGVPAQRI